MHGSGSVGGLGQRGAASSLPTDAHAVVRAAVARLALAAVGTAGQADSVFIAHRAVWIRRRIVMEQGARCGERGMCFCALQSRCAVLVQVVLPEP